MGGWEGFLRHMQIHSMATLPCQNMNNSTLSDKSVIVSDSIRDAKLDIDEALIYIKVFFVWLEALIRVKWLVDHHLLQGFHRALVDEDELSLHLDHEDAILPHLVDEVVDVDELLRVELMQDHVQSNEGARSPDSSTAHSGGGGGRIGKG